MGFTIDSSPLQVIGVLVPVPLGREWQSPRSVGGWVGCFGGNSRRADWKVFLTPPGYSTPTSASALPNLPQWAGRSEGLLGSFRPFWVEVKA